MEGNVQDEITTGPPAMCLMCTSLLQYLFACIHFPQWQDYLPNAIGNPSLNGCLSHAPESNFQQYDDPISYHSFLAQNKLDQSLSSLYTFAFETPTTSLGVLTTKDSLVMLSLLVLIIRQIKAVLLPKFCDIGRNIGKKTHGPEWEQKNPERIMKFGEYVFRFIFHSTLAAFGLWINWDAPWWDESQGGTMNIWMGHPNHNIDVGVAWYYCIQSAYNVDAIISLMEHSIVIKTQSPFAQNEEGWKSPIVVSWSPTCRGDFPEMAIHHIFTNAFIMMSSHFRLTRGGCFVFLIHDISDVPVDMSKLANFMKWKVTTVLCFVTMLIGWIYCRLYLMSFVFFKSVITESQNVCNAGAIPLDMYRMWIPFFIVLMLGICGLHFVWFYIIARIGFVLVTKGETHDLTEHKNGEKQD